MARASTCSSAMAWSARPWTRRRGAFGRLPSSMGCRWCSAPTTARRSAAPGSPGSPSWRTGGVRLGIRLDRIHPASPQENGSHERMHRTLKHETARPPAADCRRQNIRFGTWGYEGRTTKARTKRWARFPPARSTRRRRGPARPGCRRMSTPGISEVRHVASNGTVSLNAKPYSLSETLDGQDHRPRGNR